MKVETLDQAEKLINELNTKIADLEKEKSNAAVNEQVKSLEAEKKILNDQLTVANTNLESATKELEKAKNTAVELEASLKTAKESLESKTAEINKIHADAKSLERMNTLKSLGLDVEKFDEAKVKSFTSMTDESFAHIVEFTKSLKSDSKESKIDDINKAEADASKSLEDAKEKAGQKGPEDSKADENVNKIGETAAKLVAALKKNSKKVDKNTK